MYVTDSNDFRAMFSDAESFTGDFPNSNIAAWNTGNVTDTSTMFVNAQLFDADIGGWITDRVTDMSYMFQNAGNFNHDISTWNVDNVQQCRGFAEASGLADMQDLLGRQELIYRFDLIPFSPRYFWHNCR